MKIDCDRTENFLKELSRRIKDCKHTSQYCRSGVSCHDCIMLFIDNPKLGIEEIQQWSDENPPKLTIKEAMNSLSDETIVTHGHIRKSLLLALEEIEKLKEKI